MKKRKVSNQRLNRLRKDWYDILPTVMAGYPYYGVPQLVNRTIRLLRELSNERKSK